MKQFILFLWIGLLFTACSEAQQHTYVTERIVVGSGPEDLVIDRSGKNPRLLISCCERRDTAAPFGEIVSYTPATGVVDTLVRKGMPDTLFFQPHGIFLDSLSNPQRLYVISHEHDQGFHPLYVWEVGNDTLHFRELITSPLLHSPNALTLGAHGDIFIVNDSGKRGSILEKALKLNRANIVKLGRNAGGNWQGKIVAAKLGYPAGINRIGDTLYAGDAIKHKLHVYKITDEGLRPMEPIKNLRGNDNIRITNDRIYLTGHIKPFKFIRHAKSSKKISPVKVWEVDPATREITSLFYTDGSLISAGSTAVFLDGYLYISQVFEPFILQVELR
jgi:hypothetical protein